MLPVPVIKIAENIPTDHWLTVFRYFLSSDQQFLNKEGSKFMNKIFYKQFCRTAYNFCAAPAKKNVRMRILPSTIQEINNFKYISERETSFLFFVKLLYCMYRYAYRIEKSLL
jgi:hypothetical protein